jgi:hypothetical protein
MEGEDIHLDAYLPIRPEEQPAVQDRVGEIQQAVERKYGVYAVVVALLEIESPPNQLPK